MIIRRLLVIVIFNIAESIEDLSNNAKEITVKCAHDEIGCSFLGLAAASEWHFKFKDEAGERILQVEWSGNVYLSLKCSGSPAPWNTTRLGVEFSEMLQPRRIITNGCGIPQDGYALAFQEANISTTKLLRVAVRDIPTGFIPVTAFSNISLVALELTVGASPIIIKENLLDKMDNLIDLKIHGATFNVAVLPTKTQNLTLIDCKIEEINLLWVKHFPHLRKLIVHGDVRSAEGIETAAKLEELELNGNPLRYLWQQCPSLLQKIKLFNVELDNLVPLNCIALREITVSRGVLKPSRRWLSTSPNLQKVTLAVRLLELPSDILWESRALRMISLPRCSLSALPIELLRDASALEELNISQNNITDISISALESVTKSLHTLDISYNRLSTWCTTEESPLRKLRSLRVLKLSHVGLKYLCPDWRLALTCLSQIDLQWNNITTLEGTELSQWIRQDKTTCGGMENQNIKNIFIDFSHNPLEKLLLKPQEFNTALHEKDLANLTLRLQDCPLQCTCMSEFALRLTKHGTLLLQEARCSNGSDPSSLQPSLLECSLQPCPDYCNCSFVNSSPDVTIARCLSKSIASLEQWQNWDGAVDLWMEDGVLTRIPQITNVSRLHLYNNQIEDVDLDLPSSLTAIDLRNNKVQSIPESLTRKNRSIQLSGNPLRCDCGNRNQLQAARAFDDYFKLQCDDGTPLSTVQWEQMCSGSTTPVVLGVLIVITAFVVLLFAWNKRRVSKVNVLNEICGPFLYDVFVMSSQVDAMVAAESVAVLERSGVKVLWAARDWAAGGWLPALLWDALHSARFTLLPLSNAGLRDVWMRGALLGAAAERRLLLLVLDGEKALEPTHDVALQAALHSATCIYSNAELLRKLKSFK